MEAQLPKTAPKLEAKHIARHTLWGENGTACLIGWGQRAAADGKDEGGDYRIKKLFWEALDTEATLRDPLARDSCVWYLERHPESEGAALWNAAMLRLGYIDKGTHFELPEAA